MINEYQEYAAKLLFNLWRDVDADFKSQYRVKIWQMFTDNVVTAAMQTNELSQFVSKLSDMMNIGTGRNQAIRDERVRLIETLDSYQTLTAIRKTTPYIIALVRKLNDELKQSYNENEDNEDE